MRLVRTFFIAYNQIVEEETMMTDKDQKHIDADIEKVACESSEDIFGRITFLETEICEAMFEFKTRFM